MIKPFQFARIPKIFFRNGMIADLPGIIKLYGKKIVMVTGKNSFIQSRHAEKLFHDFEKAGIGYHIIVIPGEPSPDIIDQAVKRLYNEELNWWSGLAVAAFLMPERLYRP
jgi:Alcohol dehydrogenase, class IV